MKFCVHLCIEHSFGTVFLDMDTIGLSLKWIISLIVIAIFIVVVLVIGILLIFIFCLRSKGKNQIFVAYM